MEKIENITNKMLDKMEEILNSHEYKRNVDQVDEIIKILEEEYDIQIN